MPTREAAFGLGLLVKDLCIGRGWTLKGFRVFLLNFFELFREHLALCAWGVMSVQSDWESNCPRAVLQYCITTSLSEGGSGGRREGKNSSTGSFAILYGDKGSRGWSENLKIHFFMQVCVFPCVLSVLLLGESAIFPRNICWTTHLHNCQVGPILSNTFTREYFCANLYKGVQWIYGGSGFKKKKKYRMCSLCGGVSERGEVRQSCVGEGK